MEQTSFDGKINAIENSQFPEDNNLNLDKLPTKFSLEHLRLDHFININNQNQDRNQAYYDNIMAQSQTGGQGEIKPNMDMANSNLIRFYFFINPKSGSKQGGTLMKKLPNHFSYQIHQDETGSSSLYCKVGFTPIKSNIENLKESNFEARINPYEKVVSNSPQAQEIAEKKIEVKLVNLFDSEKREEKFQEVAALSHQFNTGYSEVTQHADKNFKPCLYVFACGGDGTTTWIVDSLQKYKAKFENLVVSLLPLGTGNDFNNGMNMPGK